MADIFTPVQHGEYARTPYVFKVSRQRFIMLPGLADMQAEKWIIECFRDDKKLGEVTELVSSPNAGLEEQRLQHIIGRLWTKNWEDE